MALQKLTPAIHEKVWGTPRTQPWLANPEGLNIGEIWFTAPDVQGREAMPVLVKFLFTSERLSVQVHPNDAYAQAHGAVRGKTEMWHVLRAEPDATVALGLKQSVSPERLRESALNGEIVDLLDWLPARVGDTFFVPAGTIHAIGGGLVLCEIQQLSDVTYRLFDYQRKPERELHLEDSLALSILKPTPDPRRDLPVACEYFLTERLNVSGTVTHAASHKPALFIAVAGVGTIGGEPFRAGDAWFAPVGTAFDVTASGLSIATFVAVSPGTTGSVSG